MFSKSEDIEICCDAPPYSIVRACAELGFESPLDVRWCRLGNHAESKPGTGVWQWFFGKSHADTEHCPCGRPLPLLHKYVFTLASERVAAYHLGQCRRCRTMLWDQA